MKEIALNVLLAFGISLLGVLAISIPISAIWGAFALGAKYSVWSSAKEGQAELAKADFNRQIAIREAAAKMDAAVDLAQAEITRAEGLAKANKILGDSLKGPEGESYLRYLWIENMATTKDQIIYIPTNNALPVLEAGRLK